jgi:WD40 repeat protein
LLSLDHDPATRAPTIEVAHEALLREWERLRNWLNESRSEIRLQQQLAHAAQEWHDSQQDASFLLRGSRLELFEKWVGETQLAFTPREKTFLQTSSKQREKEQFAEQERQAREVRLEQRSQNFLRGLVAVFAVATAIAISLSVFAFGQRNRAEKAQLDAEDSAEYARSLALASAARSSYLSNNPDQAIALAVAANTTTNNPPAFAQSVLYQTAFAPATHRLLLGSNSARFSPDGGRVLSWQWGESLLSYWDTETGQVAYQTSPLVEEGAITDVRFSLSGETAWVSIATPNHISDTVMEVDTASGKEIRRLTLPEGKHPKATQLVLSPDGQTLFTSSVIRTEDGTFVEGSIYAFDTASGRVIRQFAETPLDQPYELWSLGLSTDGQQVAAGYSTGAVILWDVTTGGVLHTFEGVTNGIDDVHITTEGIAANSVQIDAFTQTLTLWDIETGILLRQKVWNTVGNETALHPDGHSIALTFMGAPVTIFDVKTWETTREFYGHGSIQYTADFSSDGRWLLTASVDNELRVWNMEDGAEIKHMIGLNGNQLVGLIRNPDGRTALSQQLNGPLSLWDIETGVMIRQWGHTNMSFTGTAFSPDGRYIVSGTSEDPDLGTCPPPEAKLTLWDSATGEMIWEVETNGNATTGKAFINGGTQIATVDRWCGNDVTIWDVTTGQRVAEWEGHQKPAWGLAASPDGKTIVTASEDSTAIIWDAATGTILQVLPHNYVVRTGAFSPDGQRLVTVTNDGILHLWDTHTWQELKQLAGHSSSILFVQFSPDSRYVVSSGRDDNVFVWDLQIGEAVRQFELPSVGAWGHVVIFSPDGESLFMNVDNTVIRQINLMLEPSELLDWVYVNRHVRELTCSERTLYDLEPEKCVGQ